MKLKFKINSIKQIVKNNFIRQRGFTLMEFVVNMIIFIMMMGIAFFNYPRLSLALSFSNDSQDVLAKIREIQIKGSSRGGGYTGEGLYIKSGIKSSFKIFLDSTSTLDYLGVNMGNNLYDPDLDLLLQEYLLPNNIRITGICIKEAGNNDKNCRVGDFIITYSRPEIKANISGNIAQLDFIVLPREFTDADKGYIELSQISSPYESKNCIVVYKYGQIELHNGPCSFQD